MCHCLGVFGKAVSSLVPSLKFEEHCLTEDRQAVAQFSVDPVFFRETILHGVNAIGDHINSGIGRPPSTTIGVGRPCGLIQCVFRSMSK